MTETIKRFVTVKNLEWAQQGLYWRAVTPFGRFDAWLNKYDYDRPYWVCDFDDEPIDLWGGKHPDLESAMLAAEHRFCAMIMECIQVVEMEITDCA